jgi:predicted amidohydrolase
MNIRGAHTGWKKIAEPVPGPTTNAVAKLAKKHSMYVWCPIIVQHGKKIANAAILIDREGRIVGQYHKIFPTISEIEMGVVPGTEANVFETDFGRVGACICYDAGFREVGDQLAENGAEIVFFPSMFAAGRLLENWALQHGFFVVTSYAHHSVILNNVGRKLTETGMRFESVCFGHVPPIASATLNLDTCVCHYDYNQPQIRAIKKKYGAGVEFEFHQPEAIFAMTSQMRDVTVRDIIREFKLETRNEYYARARKVRKMALRK